MESNKVYLYSYIDMEINWLKELVSFRIIKSDAPNVEELLELVRTDLYEILGSIESVFDYEKNIEETLKLLLAKYNLYSLIPAIGIALKPNQKDEIALSLFMKKTILQHSEDYNQIIEYAKHNPSANSELLIAYMSEMRIERPTQDMNISAIKPYIVDNYFSSLSIGQKNNTSLNQYALDSLYRIHNALSVLHDEELKNEISFTIAMVRGLIQRFTDALLSDERVDDYFHKELFTSMNLFNAIIEKTSLKKKPDYKTYKIQ